MKIQTATIIDFILFGVSFGASMFFLDDAWWKTSLIAGGVYLILSLAYFAVAKVFCLPHGKPFDFIMNLVVIMMP